MADEKESQIVSESNDAVSSLFIEFSSAIDPQTISNLGNVEAIKQVGDNAYVVNSTEDIRELIFRTAVKNNWIILTMKQQERSMEDVFRSLTK